MSFEHDRWYALQVRANAEGLAPRSLEERGYTVFAPTIRRQRHWSDRIKVSEGPMFPGYIFCKHDEGAKRRMVDSPFVVRIVSYGGVPAVVDNEELASIRILAASGHEAEPQRYLAEGERVVVCAGPLEGADGIVMRLQGVSWIVLQVTLLQRAVRVVVDSDMVRPWRERDDERLSAPGLSARRVTSR